MKKKKILNQIKNLLDLAADKNNQHEAEAAAKKAQALIMKYNIQEADLRKGETADMEKSLYPLWKLQRHPEGKWLKHFFHTIAQFNFCKIVTTKKYEETESGTFKRRDYLYILGEANNVELVKYLAEQLTHRLRSIEKEKWDAYDGPESRGVYMRGFLQGANSGIHSQFRSQWSRFEEEQSTALVIRKNNEELEKFTAQQFPNLGTGRGTSTRSRSGYSDGRQTGKNMSIRGGVRGKAGSKLLG